MVSWASSYDVRETDFSFSKMTDVYEGSLIRMFRRLEELLRQMAQASKVMGSEDLEKKFEEALTKVKRGMSYARSMHCSWLILHRYCRCGIIVLVEMIKSYKGGVDGQKKFAFIHHHPWRLAHTY